jgi:hypothetical protein
MNVDGKATKADLNALERRILEQTAGRIDALEKRILEQVFFCAQLRRQDLATSKTGKTISSAG